MAMLLVSLLVMLLVISAMSVGVIMGRKPLSGSCGGVGAALGEKDYVCELCGNDESKCEEINTQDSAQASNHLAYDASSRSSNAHESEAKAKSDDRN